MISFGLTEDQAMLQETVRKFAADELRPRLREYEKARGVPAELERRFHELGLTLVDVPEAAGGMGMGMTTAVLAHEELAWGDPGAAVALWTVGHLPAALLELGTAEQAARLLDRFSGPGAASRRGAVAWSEVGKQLPEIGFTTVARADGDHWILDGEKSFVLNGGIADVYVVFAQIDVAAGWKGIGAFVVEGSNPGLTMGARAEWLGLETAHAASIKLNACRVGPDARLVGAAVTEPVAAARRMFARIAVVNAARQVGLARASYESALAYTQERVAFGKPVAHFQSVSFELAEMATEVESARWMVWRAAAELDKGAKTALTSVAMAATHANELAWHVADDGVQLLGGAGFVQDYPAEKWMRDAKTLALVGGTDELSRLVVAQAALGKHDELAAGLPASWIQPVVS
jgi:alkylation response protein AidB-like acyl-CoA dehydrogenase